MRGERGGRKGERGWERGGVKRVSGGANWGPSEALYIYT